jgi:histidine triad (HIT) family protein
MPEAPGNRSHESATCAFCRIIHGEEQASLVFEDRLSLAFLDQRSLLPGHCLLVPKQHYETLADLPAPLVGPLFQNAHLLERAIEEGLGADGTFVAINNRISQSVPHMHIHPRAWPPQGWPQRLLLARTTVPG